MQGRAPHWHYQGPVLCAQNLASKKTRIVLENHSSMSLSLLLQLGLQVSARTDVLVR